MELNENLIQRLALLSRLHLEPQEMLLIKADLQNMLGLIEKIQSVDTQDVEPLIHITQQTNLLRDDIIQPSFTPEEALRNAPSKDSEYFHVPKVVDKS